MIVRQILRSVKLSPTIIGESEEVSQEVSGDLGSHQQREIHPDVAVEAGGGEVDAVITNVGGEQEYAHDDQPQSERHCPGLTVS